MTDDFDDPDLAAALRNMAGSVPDVDAALPVFHRRVRVARIRRVSVAVSGAAAVALIAVGAVALTGNEQGKNITPMDRSITLDTVTDPSTGVAAGTTTTATTPADDEDSGASRGSGTGTTGTTGMGGTASIPPGGSTSTSTTTDDPDDPDDGDNSDDGDGPDDGDDSDDSRNGGSGSGTTTTAAPGRAVTKRCSSAGGSFTASRLTTNSVTNVSPAAGFSKTEQEIEREKITVVFAGNEVEYHVVARWTGESFSCSVES